MRIKHRYIIAQMLVDPTQSDPAVEELSSRDIVNAIREKLQVLFGDIGAGEFGGNTMVKFYDANTLIFVIRTGREAEHSVRLALAIINQVKRTSLIFRTLGVAGSGRTCLDKLRKMLDRVLEAEALSSMVDESTQAKRREQYESLFQTLEL